MGEAALTRAVSCSVLHRQWPCALAGAGGRAGNAQRVQVAAERTAPLGAAAAGADGQAPDPPGCRPERDCLGAGAQLALLSG